jgi:hypothetical protein
MRAFPQVLLDSMTAPSLPRPFYWLVDYGVLTHVTVRMLLNLRQTALPISSIPLCGRQEGSSPDHARRGWAPAPQPSAHRQKFVERAGLRIIQE